MTTNKYKIKSYRKKDNKMRFDSEMNFSQVISQLQDFESTGKELNDEGSYFLLIPFMYHAAEKGPGKSENSYPLKFSGVPAKGISWSLVFKHYFFMKLKNTTLKSSNTGSKVKEAKIY